MAALRTTYIPGSCQHDATLDCERCAGNGSGRAALSPAASRGEAPPRSSSTQKLDRWANRYVSGSFTPDESYLSSSTSGSSVASVNNKVPFRASTDHNLGLGMPSRISKDLRTSHSGQSISQLGSVPERGRSLERPPSQYLSTPSSSASTSRPSSTRDRSPNGGDYTAPILKGSDGALSKVCGSLVEPSDKRNKWACHDCTAVFARDTTIYAPPSSAANDPSTEGAYFCKQCYSARYGLGKCEACQRDVLGSTKEDGKFVKAAGGLWHGKCWRCTSCDKGAKEGVDVLVGMDGKPCCEACFDKPRKPKHPPVELKPEQSTPIAASFRSQDSDVRRLSRYGAAGKGAMGATIAELSKKFNKSCTTSTPLNGLASPTLPSSGSASSDVFRRGSSSISSLADLGGRPPSRGTLAFPDLASRSPTRGSGSMSRSGSITGSPPKPRPMTAQFTGDLNLAAFRPSFGPGSDAERGHLTRSDSRSRSYSPTKRTPLPSSSHSPGVGARSRFDSLTTDRSDAASSTAATSSKVPGSPNVRPSGTLAGPSASRPPAEFGRDRTASGFPRPLNTPFAKDKDPKEPLQGDKQSHEPEADSSGEMEPNAALPPSSSEEVRCVVCHRLPFDAAIPTASSQREEVVMITLSGGHHLHADCFTCCVCEGKIDGSRTFTRLEDMGGQYAELAPGLGPFAHPQCAPSVRLQRIVDSDPAATREGRSVNRPFLDPGEGMRDHVTHQRELRPSPNPSPASTLRGPTVGRADLPFARVDQTASSSSSGTSTGGAIRRFQPSAGAAPPTRSTILSRPATGPTPNPAAGIFSRLPPSSGGSAPSHTPSSSSNITTNPAPASSSRTSSFTTKLGGMASCAFCGEKLSALESVAGPRNTSWHRHCLICRGAPKAQPPASHHIIVRNLRAPPPTVCGKRLDSGAKVNRDGEVRCRDCFDREVSSFRVVA